MHAILLLFHLTKIKLFKIYIKKKKRHFSGHRDPYLQMKVPFKAKSMLLIRSKGCSLPPDKR